MQIGKTLYGKSRLGQTLQWSIEAENGQYRTSDGIVGGAITVSEWTDVQPTNAGRANARSAEEQAIFEATAKYQKKLKTGYSEELETAGEKSYVQVTLAEKYDDYRNEITFPATGQIKENGARSSITVDAAKSRKGEVWMTVPHITEALKPLFEAFPDAMLDGELSNHDYREQLNEIMKIVRKTKNITPEVLQESREKIKFYIYDGYGVNSKASDSYRVRFAEIKKWISENIKSPYIEFIESREINSHAEVILYFKELTEKKYEGAILRWGEHGYINGRTKHLLKVKSIEGVQEEDDDECEILDIMPGSGNWKHCAKTASIKWKDRVFDATLVGSMPETLDVWNNRKLWIGKRVTFYYMGLTGLGNPNYARIKVTNCFNDKSSEGVIIDKE